VSERKRISMSEKEVSALIEGQRKLQLGTINPDGTPHLVTMFYGLVGDQIGFWTYRTSQKARNIERDARITCLIEAGEDYFELRGALIYGTAEIVTDPNRIRYVGSEVVRRMMDIQDEAEIAPFVEQTAAKRYAYVVNISRVASWDHAKLA
jgi:PPOX class probable F420-dependent enzyme